PRGSAPCGRAAASPGRVCRRNRTTHGTDHCGSRGPTPARAKGPPRDACRFLLSDQMIAGTTMLGEQETLARRQDRLAAVIGDYPGAVAAGRPPDPSQWLAQHPDLKPELVKFLADQAHIELIVGPIRLAAAGSESDASVADSTEAAASLPETLAQPPPDPQDQ